ncbi:hypothetical protein RhiirC2_789715 [Rhizophagus irregularis]|uniref:Uncharacterized protein n=1 Tax=Rhizophagus irregularis TaxID=588596 RepID=A0A2N1MML4_9GLOM|nr:hypothetical protein RhiirC2_789715 [Rhizophagus irregularis]
MTFKYYMITVLTKDKLSHLNKTSPPELQNVKIYEYTQHNIDTLIEQKLQLQDNTIIKILDIPIIYDVTLLIKQITDATGKRIPIYKQLIISFEDKAVADYLLKQDWCIAIKDSVARILPGNPKHPIYTQRTSTFYKITGLPLNTNAKDLSPLVTHLKGRTCTFTQTSRSSLFKNASIYVHPDDIKKDYTTITGTKFGLHTIFIFPHTNTKKACNVCGSHTHEYKTCTSTDFTLDKNERKIYKKRFIVRNKECILINETTRQNYNHIIRLSNNNPGKSNIQPRPQPDTRGKQKQTYNNNNKNPNGTHQQSSQTAPIRQQPARKAKRTSTPYEKTPLKEVKKWFIQPSAESAIEDSNALPLSDEYYTESGEVSDTNTIENTYEASEENNPGQSSFILNPFNWGNKPQV